jgi:hypothetical protein
MHVLRHTYASVLPDAGESIKALAAYLGHADPGFTLRTYTHLLPTSEDRTRRAIDQAFGDGLGTVDGLETAQTAAGRLPPQVRAGLASLPLEVHEQTAEVLGVLLDPVVLGLDLLLIEEPQYPLLQLARTLARDDLHERRLLLDRLGDDAVQRPLEFATAVVDVMQVQLEFHVAPFGISPAYVE